MVKIIDFCKEALRGRTLYRILFSWEIEKHCYKIEGPILDIGGGRNPTYQKYLGKDAQLVRSEPFASKDPDVLLDMNEEKWDIEPESYQTIFCHNTLYIAKEPRQVLRNIYAVLKPRGQLFLTTPFVFRESPEPTDYDRYTSARLEEMLKSAGFQEIQIIPFGKSFSTCAYVLYPFMYFRVIKLVLFGLALLLDKGVPKRFSVPLGFFTIAKK
ncbi:methyltransferase domain-containing protein [Candidatus Nomurabacteria bacterium]|nr:methyltransferase domain-containing protein [Candidatus Nomurabacteria bacterium]